MRRRCTIAADCDGALATLAELGEALEDELRANALARCARLIQWSTGLRMVWSVYNILRECAVSQRYNVHVAQRATPDLARGRCQCRRGAPSP